MAVLLLFVCLLLISLHEILELQGDVRQDDDIIATIT